MDRATLEAQWAAQIPVQRFRTAESWLRAELETARVQVERTRELDPENPDVLAWVTASHPSTDPLRLWIVLVEVVFHEEWPDVAVQLIERIVLPWAHEIVRAAEMFRERAERERWYAAARAQAARALMGLPSYTPSPTSLADYYLKKWAEELTSLG